MELEDRIKSRMGLFFTTKTLNIPIRPARFFFGQNQGTGAIVIPKGTIMGTVKDSNTLGNLIRKERKNQPTN